MQFSFWRDGFGQDRQIRLFLSNSRCHPLAPVMEIIGILIATTFDIEALTEKPRILSMQF